MDKIKAKRVMKGTANLLRSIRSHSTLVYSNPSAFDDICDALEKRAKFIDTLFCTVGTGKTNFVVMTKLIYNGVFNANVRVDSDGNPYHAGGKRLLKPNGDTWNRLDLILEKKRLKTR